MPRLILIFKTSPDAAVVHADTVVEAAGAHAGEGHGEHALEPFTSLYVAAAHGKQGPLTGPVKPRKHPQAVPASEFENSGQLRQNVAPGVENNPAAHVEQSCIPCSILNVPALQGTHPLSALT